MIYRVVAKQGGVETDIFGTTRDTILLDPTLSLEVNAAGSFDFTMPVENVFYNSLRVMGTLFYIYEKNDLIWWGRAVEVSTDWKNRKKVHCEGALAFLNDTVQRPVEYGAYTTVTETFDEAKYPPSGYDSEWSTGDIVIGDQMTVTATYHDNAVKITSIITKTTDSETGTVSYSTEYSTSTMTNTTTLHDFFRDLLYCHNAHCGRGFEPGNITVTDKENVYRKLEWETTWDAIQRNCLDTDGGYLVVRVENGTNYLDWLATMPATNNQPAQFALNLLDISQELNISEFGTICIPLGATVEGTDQKLTIVDSDLSGGNDSIRYTPMYPGDVDPVDLYGNVEKVVDFSDISVPNDLYWAGWNWLVNEIIYQGKVITVSAAELNYLNDTYTPFKLGAMVHVYSTPHGVDTNLPIVKIDLNLNSAAKKISIGTPSRTNLSDISRKETSTTIEKKQESSIKTKDLTVTQNGTYTASTGTAYSTVRVDVPGSTIDINYAGSKWVRVSDNESYVIIRGGEDEQYDVKITVVTEGTADVRENPVITYENIPKETTTEESNENEE